MSKYGPYDEYEPNEPAPIAGKGAHAPLSPARPLGGGEPASSGAPVWTAGAWEPPMASGHSYTPRTWDEEEYTPNEPPAPPPRRPAAIPPASVAEGTSARARGAENPYARPTWDETAFDETPSGRAAYTGDARRAQAAGYLEGDEYADAVPSRPLRARRAETAAPAEPPVGPASSNPYARPAASARDGVSDESSRFAPPLKFELPGALYGNRAESAADAPEPQPAQPNVYRTRNAPMQGVGDMAFDPAARADAYRVEAELSPLRAKRRRRAVRRVLFVLLVLAALAALAYFNRGWILDQLKPLLGEEAVESVHQAVDQAVGTAPTQSQTAAYDPAPALQVGERARQGIAAVAGSLALEPYAVTTGNVIQRVATGEGVYDYYLFAAGTGQLLGYYEGLGANGFLVCPDDVYYIAQPPWLIDENGRALVDVSRYQSTLGPNAELGPMINGWSIISNAGHTTFNYINAGGSLLSTLWFARAFPFTADTTLAYVDTGNVSSPDERYTLYELTHGGSMTLWKHTADMSGVLGCACGVAYLDTGELILLGGKHAVLCKTDDVAAYADCGAVVARDPATGLYALFVNGEQHYDFAYDSIAPVSSDIRWASAENGAYRQLTVTGHAYPLPLSHYFALRKGDQQEMVALSTRTVCELLLPAITK